MTDTAQERERVGRPKTPVEWTDEELVHHLEYVARDTGWDLTMMVAGEVARRLRARQREEGDVDTRTIGLALNDIRSIVRQDWTWTTELQRHYDLAMDALRPEPPTEQEQDDGPVDMDRVIKIARYNAANDVGVGPSYVSHLLAYIDDLEADATPQREGEREPDWPTVMDYITDLQAAVVQLQREVGMLADEPPADTEQGGDNA